MTKYKVTARHTHGDFGPISSVQIKPCLTEESRRGFVSPEEKRLLDQFTTNNVSRHESRTFSAIDLLKDHRVVRNTCDQTQTIQAVIESAAFRTAQILRCAGEVVEYYLNGVLQEDKVPVEESLVDEQTDPIAG